MGLSNYYLVKMLEKISKRDKISFFLLKIIGAIFIVILPFIFNKHTPYNLQIEMETSAITSVGTIYIQPENLDSCKGYDLKNSFRVYRGNELKEYIISLPPCEIKSIRIDPMTNQGEIIIHSIQVKEFLQAGFIVDEDEIARSIEEATNVNLMSRNPLVIESSNNDPYFFISNLPNYSGETLMEYNFTIAAILLCFYTVILILIHIFNIRSIYEKIQKYINRTNNKKYYLPYLDGLRFFSVLLVILSHAIGGISATAGRVGVAIFFVLSGFLITYLLIKEWEKNNSINIKLFYTKRFLRIIPGFVFISTLFITAMYIIDADNFGTYYIYPIKSLIIMIPIISELLLKNIFDYQPYFSHTWTLKHEMYFYFIWPIFLVGILLLKNIIIRIILLVLLIFGSFFISSLSTEYEGLKNISIFFNTSLLIGSALGFLYYYCSDLLKAFSVKIIMYVSCILLLFLSTSIPIFIKPGYLEISLLGFVLVSSLLTNNSLLKNFLSLPVFTYLGRISYGLYLVHFPVIRILVVHFGYEQNVLLFFLSSFITILISIASYHLVEEKFLLIKKVLSK